MTPAWVEPLLKGGVSLVVTALLFGAARLRFARDGDRDAPLDTGLD